MVLDMKDNNISSEAVDEIVDILSPNTKLHELYLGQNNLKQVDRELPLNSIT